MVKIIDINNITTKDMEGCKILRSDDCYGLYIYNGIFYKFLRCIVTSRTPFRKGRLLRIAFRKFTIDIYNQVWFSLHKTDLMYGAHIGFLRVIWNRF